MNFITLLEELKDIPTHNTLYHGTNLLSLFYILKNGFLKPSKYNISLTDKPEIATGRKAMISGKDVSPSANIGSIVIELYKDRILGSKEHRGVSLKPIAEFAVDYQNKINQIKKNNENINKNYDKIKKIHDDLSKNNKISFEKYEEFKDAIFKKIKIEKTTENLKDLKALFYYINSLKYSTQPDKREKEERFYFRKKSIPYIFTRKELEKVDFGIKVSPLFMKIKVRGASKDFYEELKNAFSFGAMDSLMEKHFNMRKDISREKYFKKIIELLEKNKEIFEEESYEKLMNFFKKERFAYGL